jgi:putative transposase
MSALRRKFPLEQKLQIVQEAAAYGVVKALRKYQLSYSVLSRWRQQLAGMMQVTANTDTSYAKKELDALQLENTRLKKIIANQALELEMMNERLKKTKEP